MNTTLKHNTKVSVLKKLARIVGWVLVWAFAIYFWPASLGGQTTTIIVSGQSMYPTYYNGDIVIARKGTPKVNDIVVYSPHSFASNGNIIHRIIDGNETDGWIIQGDNNGFIDPFKPKNDEIIGIAQWHIHGSGSFIKIISTPTVWVSLLLLSIALFIFPSNENKSKNSTKNNNDDSKDLNSTFNNEQKEIKGGTKL